MGQDRPWLRFRMPISISGDNPSDQADRFAEYIVGGDPRETTEVCGGSPDFARQLGYTWPQRRRT
jgi:hypothetical protein